MEGKRTQAEKLAVIAAIVGAVILIVGLVLFIWHEKFSLQHIIKSDKVGQLGDFVGGVVGSFWALTGVLLLYATLKSQQKQLKIHSREFEINRITNTIFKQIERIDNSIKELRFISSASDLKFRKGANGIHYVNDFFRVKNKAYLEYPEENNIGSKDIIYKLTIVISLNELAINKLYSIIFDSNTMIVSLINATELKRNQKEELLGIYLLNIIPEAHLFINNIRVASDFCIKYHHSDDPSVIKIIRDLIEKDIQNVNLDWRV